MRDTSVCETTVLPGMSIGRRQRSGFCLEQLDLRCAIRLERNELKKHLIQRPSWRFRLAGDRSRQIYTIEHWSIREFHVCSSLLGNLMFYDDEREHFDACRAWHRAWNCADSDSESLDCAASDCSSNHVTAQPLTADCQSPRLAMNPCRLTASCLTPSTLF